MTTKRIRPTRFRLVARVPNEGARRFARWLLSQPAGAYDRLSRARGIGIVTLDRMLSGEIVPDAVLAHRIFAATRCAVAINDWDRPAEGGWFDAVAAQRRAA